MRLSQVRVFIKALGDMTVNPLTNKPTGSDATSEVETKVA